MRRRGGYIPTRTHTCFVKSLRFNLMLIFLLSEINFQRRFFESCNKSKIINFHPEFYVKPEYRHAVLSRSHESKINLYTLQNNWKLIFMTIDLMKNYSGLFVFKQVRFLNHFQIKLKKYYYWNNNVLMHKETSFSSYIVNKLIQYINTK